MQDIISTTGKGQYIVVLMSPMNDQWTSCAPASIDTGLVYWYKDQ
jgi:hypothetical protein